MACLLDQMFGLTQRRTNRQDVLWTTQKRANITICFLCSLQVNISLPFHGLVWLIPLCLCPSLPLMMPSWFYTEQENISVRDWQWHLHVTPPPVTAYMTAESSLEDKSTWLSQIDSTSNDILVSSQWRRGVVQTSGGEFFIGVQPEGWR